MRVALFVPCYVDQLYPDVALAALELLERLGVTVDVPDGQTCCGQPLANSGCTGAVAPMARRYAELFAGYEHVVCPSGSCVSMVRQQHPGLCGDGGPAVRTIELCQFLTDVLGVKGPLPARFPHRVGLHQSCHGLRELRLGPSSELVAPGMDRARRLLAAVEGVELVEPARPDECCGFGGTFAVAEEAVSCRMGNDRLTAHQAAGAEVITATDVSCLMHLEGLARRQGRPIAFLHIAQILAGRPLPSTEATIR